MAKFGKSEHIIQNVVGCGPFQITLFLLVNLLTGMATAFTAMFMAFGMYSPGWRCLDEVTAMSKDTVGLHNTTTINSTVSPNNTVSSGGGGGYVQEQCPAFDSCKNVEFNPEASTVVTEWGLICGNTWSASIVISLQMFGLLIGCSLTGFLGDAIGRKTTIYGGQVALFILNTIIIFSNSWQMFGALRFLLGVAIAPFATLHYVYGAEFVTLRWRGPLPNIPTWPINSAIFGVFCLILKDWRHIHIACAVFAAVGLIPVFWLPESLRWLEVKNKTEKFEKAAKSIARFNGKTLPPLEDINIEKEQEEEDEKVTNIFRDTLRLFKSGYVKKTLIITVPWFSVSLVYYAIGFGVKALSGNFYINLIVVYILEIIVDFLLMMSPNVIGRKKTGMTFSGIAGICLLAAAIFQKLLSGDSRVIGVAAFAMIGRISIGLFWCLMMTYTVELYPTVVRAVATSWGNTIARVGGIIAPFLIPSDSSTFFICYAVMGVISILCAVIIIFLPETRGKKLQETFDDKDNSLNKDDLKMDNVVI